MLKKTISNEEYERAYNNKDNRKIINKVTSRYVKQLDSHDRQSCGLIALWRCLENHQDIYKQKFTSSLWRFVHWECRRELRKKNRKKQLQYVLVPELDYVAQKNTDETNVQECIMSLGEQHREMLKDYFYENKTMQEIADSRGFSKETARQKINKAIKQFTLIYNKD